MSDEHREQIWAELEARAQRLLDHPKDVEPREPIRRYGSLVRLWHFPAFGPQMTWTILTPGKKATPDTRPMVRELTWDRTADDLRIFDPRMVVRTGVLAPTVRVRDADMPAERLQDLMEQGSRLSVPIFLPVRPVGLEGEYFGLETYETSPFVRLQWWNEGPAEWRHFSDWVAGVRKFVVSLLDRS